MGSGADRAGADKHGNALWAGPSRRTDAIKDATYRLRTGSEWRDLPYELGLADGLEAPRYPQRRKRHYQRCRYPGVRGATRTTTGFRRSASRWSPFGTCRLGENLTGVGWLRGQLLQVLHYLIGVWHRGDLDCGLAGGGGLRVAVGEYGPDGLSDRCGAELLRP